MKFDIKKFFDSVDHQILLDILKQKISCPETISLLAEIVGSFSKPQVLGGGSLLETDRPRGLPIGNLTSQLFANVYMNAFDHYIKEELRTKYYLRYTDDTLIVHNDPKYLSLLVPFIQHWLWQNRRLSLHPNKVSIRKLLQGIDWLGYVVLPYHRVLRTKTKRRMLKRMNEENLPSYLGELSHADTHRLQEDILNDLWFETK